MPLPNLTDIHAHYDEAVFEGRRKEVLLAQRQAGLCCIINSGSDLPSSRRSAELAAGYDFVWASVGIFPLSAGTATGDWLDRLRALAAAPRVVAIGEIGLDYRLPDTDRQAQMAAFLPQLALARELGLPVVLHDCLADEDILQALDRAPGPAVIHRFFSGVEYGRRFLARGVCLSIGPAITYPDAGPLIQTVREMPLTQLLLETDCPFLPTARHEGQPATSDMLQEVCELIASQRGGLTAGQVAEIAKQNAVRVFGLPL